MMMRYLVTFQSMMDLDEAVDDRSITFFLFVPSASTKQSRHAVDCVLVLQIFFFQLISTLSKKGGETGEIFSGAMSIARLYLFVN